MKLTLYTARFLVPISAPPIEDGALLVGDNRILAVGERKQLISAYPAAEITDFGDTVLLPPMVNAHTHLELSHYPKWARQAGEIGTPQDFVDWILQLVRVRQSIDTSQLKDSLAAGLHASLAAGTGAVGDIVTTLDLIDLYRKTPLSGKLYVELLGQDVSIVHKRLDVLARLLKTPPGPNMEWGLSPHAPYTLSASAMNLILKFATEKSLQKCIHLGESRDETHFLQEGAGPIAEKLYAAALWDPEADRISGGSPVKALRRSRGLNDGDLAVHGVQVDSEDVALLKESGCAVVLCPRSNAVLNVGKSPVKQYLQAGIPLALGTDSLASAPSLSLWEELAFAQNWFADCAKPEMWLRIATMGGAQALALNSQSGDLSAGTDASFQVVQLSDMLKRDELEATLCHAGSSVNVTHLYLGGQNVLP